MHSPRAAHSTYADMSPAEREFNDLVMNPLNWLGFGLARVAASRLFASRAGTVLRTAGSMKRPFHSLAIKRAPYDLGWLGGPLSPRVSSALTRSMAARKKGNLALMSLSAVNPFENLLYASRKDWTRLFINYHVPFIGVPIYERITASKSPQGKLIASAGNIRTKIPKITPRLPGVGGPRSGTPASTAKSSSKSLRSQLREIEARYARQNKKTTSGSRRKCGKDRFGTQLYWNGKKCVPFNKLRYRRRSGQR